MNASTQTATIDVYINGFPSEVKRRLEQMRATIARAAPDATQKMSYGIPTFLLNGNLVHFGGYARHIGFYPGASGVAAFQDELKAYKGAKGSVQFPLDEPLPLNLVTKIVKFRVVENLNRKTKKKSR